MNRPLTALLRLSAGTLATGLCALVTGCAGQSVETPAPNPTVAPLTFPIPAPPPAGLPPVMLGIDVLEAERFQAIAGKKIGLLTHAKRHGVKLA